MKSLFACTAVGSLVMVVGCATAGGGDTPYNAGSSAGSSGAPAQSTGGAPGSSVGGAAGSSSGGAAPTVAEPPPGLSGAVCHEATAATDCATDHTCADWGKAGAPDLRCTRSCDYWAKAPGCEGDDLCLPSNLCVPRSIIELSTTYTGACETYQEGYGCRAWGGKLGGMCFRMPWENWPMCSEFCRPTEGFGASGSDCASFQKCQPALLDEQGAELQTLGLCV